MLKTENFKKINTLSLSNNLSFATASNYELWHYGLSPL